MNRFSRLPISSKDQAFLKDAAKWDAITNLTIGVDNVIREMEAIWGVGRLLNIVSDDTRARFHKGHALWAQALLDGDLEAARDLAPKMAAAWRYMGKECDALGKAPLAPEVWETALGDDQVLAVVRTNAEAHAVAKDGRNVVVYSLAEIARLVGKNELINLIKSEFPGSEIIRTRHSEGFASAWATDSSTLELHEMEEGVAA